MNAQVQSPHNLIANLFHQLSQYLVEKIPENGPSVGARAETWAHRKNTVEKEDVTSVLIYQKKQANA